MMTEPLYRPERAIITRGLEALYDFKTGAGGALLYDMSSNRRHMPLGAAGAAPTWDNTGLSFASASTQYAGAATIFGTGQTLSMLAVINAVSAGTNRAIIGASAAGGQTVRLSTTDKLELLKSNTTLIGSSAAAYSGGWTCAGLTYVSGTLLFYKNGALETSLSPSAASFTTGLDTFAGREYNGAYWNDKIAAILIYSRVLTADEILQNYRALQAMLSPRGVNLP